MKIDSHLIHCFIKIKSAQLKLGFIFLTPIIQSVQVQVVIVIFLYFT
jgi:hypothetical protein